MDPRSNYRDGFTQVIKSLPISDNHRIILVEPNPFNINNLNKCWEKYSNIEIFQIGITEKYISGKDLDFFYTELDAPHYQVASFDARHVLKHYDTLDKSELKLLKVGSIDLESFIYNTAGTEEIALIALDIEGMDAEIILDTDFSKFNINFISFEYIHLGEKSNDVYKHLEKCGFYHVGYGVDHNGYDYLYRRLQKYILYPSLCI